MLNVNGLTVKYGSVVALEGANLRIDAGEVVALLGPNGAGKSTALKAIAGLVVPASGEIVFDGRNIVGYKTHELVRMGLVLVPERRHIFPSMTVLENLELGAYIRSDKRSIRRDIERVFALFPVLREKKNHRAGTLSGGQQQMLAIGRALMSKPKMLLLDEPSVGLSPNYVEAVFEKIREINRQGTTILFVEQNVRIALEYSDRAYVFGIGRIEFEGPSKELLKDKRVRNIFTGEDFTPDQK